MKKIILAIMCVFIIEEAQCATVPDDTIGNVKTIGLPHTPGIVTDEEFVEIVSRHKGTLETVGLTYFSQTTSAFKSRTMLDLADALREAPNLKAIDLWETGLSEANLLLLTGELKCHQGLEVIRICYRRKALSEALTDNLIELIKTCPNLCGVLTRGGDHSPAHDANELKLYSAACELRRGHVLGYGFGYSDNVVPADWIERAKAHNGRKDHPHGWSSNFKYGILIFAKLTDPENYSEYQPIKGQDYFERPNNGQFVMDISGQKVTYVIKLPYFIPLSYCEPIEFKRLQDVQRYVASKRLENAYEHVADGFKSGIQTPELFGK